MAVNVSNVPGFSAQLGIKINFSSSNVKKEAQPLNTERQDNISKPNMDVSSLGGIKEG